MVIGLQSGNYNIWKFKFWHFNFYHTDFVFCTNLCNVLPLLANRWFMTDRKNKRDKSFKQHDFSIIWKYFPFQRPFKETLKNFLFSYFPKLFNHWEIYQNWRNATVYRNTRLKIYQFAFWKRRLFDKYSYRIKTVNETGSKKVVINRLAVIVHAFYADIFFEIYQTLLKVEKTKLSLYLTGPEQVLSQIKAEIAGKPLPVKYFPVKNHGRDILPFLKILPVVFADGYTIVLKLHTKRSNHLNRRDHWRNDLFAKLTGSGCVDRMMEIFRSNSSVGIIGPSGNIMPMYLYYAANGLRVHTMANKMGVTNQQLADLNFVAGSMFYARKEALLPVLGLHLSEADFEQEQGQNDGTMAHAIERVFAVGLVATGLQMADTDYNFEKPVLIVNKINKFII